jgi:hypothetical protein
MTKLRAKEPIISVAGLLARNGRNTSASEISATSTTTATTAAINTGQAIAPTYIVAMTFADGTISAYAPIEMKSPCAKLINRRMPNSRPMPSAARA